MTGIRRWGGLTALLRSARWPWQPDRLARNKRRLRRLPPKRSNPRLSSPLPRRLPPKRSSPQLSSRHPKPNSLRLRRRRLKPSSPSLKPRRLHLRFLLQNPSSPRLRNPVSDACYRNQISFIPSTLRPRHLPPKPSSQRLSNLRPRRLPLKPRSPRLSSHRRPAAANRFTPASPAAWMPMRGYRTCWPTTSFSALSRNWTSYRPNRPNSTAAFWPTGTTTSSNPSSSSSRSSIRSQPPATPGRKNCCARPWPKTTSAPATWERQPKPIRRSTAASRAS